ncbi:zinc finger protein 62 homolog [Tigriopus californicus]|uniref:zinc finger protein 62 homolog n=1 Tax=Tigriopus californicus TaxID=6832 RepID=UPI0027DA609E|nr:zinc finger protein 62 homolog [Tigriopus californicus]
MGSIARDVQSQLELLAGDVFHIHRVEQWIILTSNQFDLHLPDETGGPPFQSLHVLYNWQTQEFVCRTMGRCLERGSFDSLDQLAQFAQDTFQGKSACIGSGDFPASSVFSEGCAKYITSSVPHSPIRNSQDCKPYLNVFRCDSCQTEAEKGQSSWMAQRQTDGSRGEFGPDQLDLTSFPQQEKDLDSDDDHQVLLFEADDEAKSDVDLDLSMPQIEIGAKREAVTIEVDDVVDYIKEEHDLTASIFPVNEVGLPQKRRGRPPKRKALLESDRSETDSSDVPSRKQRGRPPKPKNPSYNGRSERDSGDVPSRKQRGRPPKPKNPIYNGRSERDSGAPPRVKKRGRPPNPQAPQPSGLSENEQVDPGRQLAKPVQVYPKNLNNKRDADGKYKCEYCDHRVTTLSGKLTHKKLYHGWGRFACDSCPSVFKEALVFCRHIMDTHVGVSEGTCPQCQQRINFDVDEQVFEGHYMACVRSNRMAQYAKLVAAQRLKTPETVQCTCDTCGRTFNSLQRLKIHRRIHEGKGSLCKECGFWASHPSVLKCHMQKHEREKGLVSELICPHCARVCLGPGQYKTHLESRHQPFQCSQCPEVFLGKRLLNIHSSAIHGANRCDTCAMCFTSIGILRRHRLTHSEPSFQCRFCPKMFKAERCLVNHERIHTGETPYECTLCDYKTKTSAALSLHKKIKHNGGRRLRTTDDE